MMTRLSQSVEKIPEVKLSRKWTLGGLIVAASAFFLHPDACISSKNIIEFLTPHSAGDAVSHIGLIVGGILAILGRGLMEKDHG